MTSSHSTTDLVASGQTVALRRVCAADLSQIARYPFTVAIDAPLSDPADLAAAFASSGFWQDEAGALAIVRTKSGEFIGTTQFYRSAPCIHGFELGYIIHDPANRGRGAATEAVSLFRHYLFRTFAIHRLQLVIETWNVASWKLAERCGFVREGLLRSAGFGEADPADCFIYAQTRKDWREGEARPTSMGGRAPMSVTTPSSLATA
jgi:RimJ/RimL family protein N-acetyltransferase